MITKRYSIGIHKVKNKQTNKETPKKEEKKEGKKDVKLAIQQQAAVVAAAAVPASTYRLTVAAKAAPERCDRLCCNLHPDADRPYLAAAGA